MFTRHTLLGDQTPTRPANLSTVDDDDSGGGAVAELGFPANTAVEAMKPEEQTAYWRNQAKVQQEARKAAEKQTAGLEELREKAAKWEKHAVESQTEHEKALNQAREEARREGENLGAQRYLGDAVRARFQALTGRSEEDTDTAFAVVDIGKFIAPDGAIDVQKIQNFAATFGPSGADALQQQTPIDPVRAAIERQRFGAGSGNNGDGSVAAIREQARERLQGAGNK